jgi:hypothetical protein
MKGTLSLQYQDVMPCSPIDGTKVSEISAESVFKVEYGSRFIQNIGIVG